MGERERDTAWNGSEGRASIYAPVASVPAYAPSVVAHVVSLSLTKRGRGESVKRLSFSGFLTTLRAAAGHRGGIGCAILLGR